MIEPKVRKPNYRLWAVFRKDPVVRKLDAAARSNKNGKLETINNSRFYTAESDNDRLRSKMRQILRPNIMRIGIKMLRLRRP